jgi:GxxExxY protein
MRLGSNSSPQTFAIIGAAIEVQRHLGTRLLESAYGDALECEFADRGIPFEREVGLTIQYKARDLRTKYRADFLCHGSILLELKASAALGDHDIAQILHYMDLTGCSVGLLLNFGRAPMQIRRLVGHRAETISPDFVDFVAGSSSEEMPGPT